MQLTIERSALLKALGHVQSVVERRKHHSDPVQCAAERRSGSSGLRRHRSGTWRWVDEAEAQVQVEGQITAPAHTLYEIVRKLPEGAEVSLLYSGDDPRLVVSAGRSRFNLPVLPAGDFPVMSTESAGASYVLPKEDLARLIDKTRFAVSTEETRYYLNGLYLHTVAEQGIPLLRAVATDGTPAGPGRDPGAGRGGGRPWRHRAAQDRRSGPPPAGRRRRPRRGPGLGPEDPLPDGRGLPDLQGHRRRLPRLSARHPARQTTNRPTSTTPCSPRPSTAWPPSRRKRAAR